jgi:L-lactate dehydrogenase complex protein LldG
MMESGNDSQRQTILGQIRASLNRDALDSPPPRTIEQALVPARARGDAALLVQRFVQEAEEVATTVHRVASNEDVPDEVARYLAAENLPAVLRMAPDHRLAAIPWTRRPTITVTIGDSDGGDEVGLTGALAGVAETGTLVLHSGPESPTTLNFLPATHIVVLNTDQIVGAYEQAIALLRAAGPLPRTINFITGPSRTADIEQQLELGAHGPRRLHIVLVEDASIKHGGEHGADNGGANG